MVPLLALFLRDTITDPVVGEELVNQFAGSESREQYATYDCPLCCVIDVSHVVVTCDEPWYTCMFTLDGLVTMTLPSASLTW